MLLMGLPQEIKTIGDTVSGSVSPEKEAQAVDSKFTPNHSDVIQ